MYKNLPRNNAMISVPAVIAILILTAVVVLSLYVIRNASKPNVNVTGGSVLVYEIDTNGLTDTQKKDLSKKVIRVLQKRVDPRGMTNLLWRPLGDSRFEILMPTNTLIPEKRKAYENALSELLSDYSKDIPNKNFTQDPLKKNLTEDRVMSVLNIYTTSSKRKKAIISLKKEFPQNALKIDKLVAAYDAYYPFSGWLETPEDLQRMLKGTGILEFRILPTDGHPDVDMAQMKTYIDTLKSSGPADASDDKYVWIEIDDPQNWRSADGENRPSIVVPFGIKYYVLASNKKDEVVLQTGRDWKIVRASPGKDSMGRRAIDFELDERGGQLFANVTGKNIEKPLCILLDNLAVSAPNIQSRIYTRGQITGNFTMTEVADIVSKLNAGSLPAPLIEEPVSITTIAPRSGANATDKNMKNDNKLPKDNCDL